MIYEQKCFPNSFCWFISSWTNRQDEYWAYWPLRPVVPSYAMHDCLATFKWVNRIAKNDLILTHILWSKWHWPIHSAVPCKTTHTSLIAVFLQQQSFCHDTENQQGNVGTFQCRSSTPTDLRRLSVQERLHYPHPFPYSEQSAVTFWIALAYYVILAL